MKKKHIIYLGVFGVVYSLLYGVIFGFISIKYPEIEFNTTGFWLLMVEFFLFLVIGAIGVKMIIKRPREESRTD